MFRKEKCKISLMKLSHIFDEMFSNANKLWSTVQTVCMSVYFFSICNCIRFLNSTLLNIYNVKFNA